MAATSHISSQLKDIKPPVEISDWSVIWYWLLIMLLVVLAVSGLYIIYRTLRKLKKVNLHKQYLETLKRINWNNTKHDAYEATRLGRLLSKDDERLQGIYKQMVSQLEKYKYKKKVESINPKDKAQFDLFVKVCDESI